MITRLPFTPATSPVMPGVCAPLDGSAERSAHDFERQLGRAAALDQAGNLVPVDERRHRARDNGREPKLRELLYPPCVDARTLWGRFGLFGLDLDLRYLIHDRLLSGSCSRSRGSPRRRPLSSPP